MESIPRATPSSAPAHVEVLHGMRGILTLVVVANHVVSAFLFALPMEVTKYHYNYFVFAHGSEVALPMYFVISGFVIFLPGARGEGSLGNIRWYVLRRFARIVPAYYACLATLLLVWPFLFTEAPSPMASRHGIELVLGHLVFLQTLLFRETEYGFGLNGSVWSLTLEEFFYATIPILAPLVFRRPFRAFFGALIVTVGWRLGSYFLPELAVAIGASRPDDALPSHVFRQYPGYAFHFITGAVVAQLYARYWGSWTSPRWWKTSRMVHAACLIFIPLYTVRVGFLDRYRFIPRDVTYDMVPAFVFALLILVVTLGPPGPKKLYTNVVWRFFGDISYGIYLWHMLLVQVVYRYAGVRTMTPAQVILTYVLCVIPTSIALGWLSFHLIERPFSAYVKKLYRERQDGLAMPAAGASDGARAPVNA